MHFLFLFFNSYFLSAAIDYRPSQMPLLLMSPSSPTLPHTPPPQSTKGYSGSTISTLAMQVPHCGCHHDCILSRSLTVSNAYYATLLPCLALFIIRIIARVSLLSVQQFELCSARSIMASLITPSQKVNR